MTTMRRSVATTGGAAVIAAAIAFTPSWEGMDRVAKRDRIGTGHPVTYCYGQTSEFGDVKVGTVFTKKECDQKLAESLPKYLDEIDRCIKVDLPVKMHASFLDAAWNAGSAAVCRSPMVARANAGDLEGACDAFDGWYVTTKNDGVRKEVPGLIDRRAGELHGDSRKSERALCLEGLREAGFVKPATPAAPLPITFPVPAPCNCGKAPEQQHRAPSPEPKRRAVHSIKRSCISLWNVVNMKETKVCR